MEMLSIKNLLQLKTETKAGMIFRRVWFHKTGEEVLDRKIIRVQTNGMWVEDLEVGVENSQGLWCEWGKATDWFFKDGKVYMIFNHYTDYANKKKTLSKEDFEKYEKRYKEYIKNTLHDGLKVKNYKVLGIYEIWRV